MGRNAVHIIRTIRTGCVLLGLALALPVLALGSEAAFAAWSDASADRVLGQSTFNSRLPNQGSITPIASSLLSPAGVSVNQSSGRLYVADRENKRVQSWAHAASFANGASADKTWQGTGPGPYELDPVATATDASGNLYVADLVHNRVLVYPPLTTTLAYIIGQVNILSTSDNQGGDPAANTLSGPYSVATDTSSHLYVADQTNNRVLRYTVPITMNNQAADLVLGQDDFVSVAPTECGEGHVATNNKVCKPQGVAVDSDGSVYVSDTGNNRVLKFAAPLSNGMIASLVLGQSDYGSNSPNRGDFYPTAQTLDNPVGIAVDTFGRIYVADANNHRVIGYSPAGIVNGAAARFIVGQADFTTKLNPFPPSAESLAYPKGVALDIAMNLYVADTYNNRALGYDLPWTWDVQLPLIIK